METIIKTIPADNGSLYAICGNDRYLMAKCRAEIQIAEDSKVVPALGSGKVIAGRHALLMITFAHKDVRTIDADTIDRIGFQGDLLRKDGRFERMNFGCCELNSDLDLSEDGTCEFSIRCSPEIIRKLRFM